MKGFAVFVLCVLAGAQARNVAVKSDGALGPQGSLVHLRIAVSTSGRLTTCAGSLISHQDVITAASCVEDARFIWHRFGALNLIHPELVLESGPVSINLHPKYDPVTGANNIAIVSFTRVIHSTETIYPVAVETSEGGLAESGTFCRYGGNNGVPGQRRECLTFGLEEQGDFASASGDQQATEFDLGGPLVADGVQVGLLVSAPGPNDSSSGLFLRVGKYYDWLRKETNNFREPTDTEEESDEE